VFTGLIGGPAGGESDPTAARDIRIAGCLCVPYNRPNIFGLNAERFRQLHCDRSPRSADICRTFDQAYGAVGIDAYRRARFQPDVEPESRCNASPDLLRRMTAWNGRQIMFMAFGCFDRLDQTDAWVDNAIRTARAFFGTVSHTKVERIH